MKKKNLIIALGVTTAALAALVPYRVEKDESEAEEGKTVVKLKSLSYALNVSVEKKKGVDVVLKVPGITSASIVNVEKHIDLPKDEEGPAEEDDGEELVTDEEFDISEEDAEVEEDIADAAEDTAEEAEDTAEEAVED